MYIYCKRKKKKRTPGKERRPSGQLIYNTAAFEPDKMNNNFPGTLPF